MAEGDTTTDQPEVEIDERVALPEYWQLGPVKEAFGIDESKYNASTEQFQGNDAYTDATAETLEDYLRPYLDEYVTSKEIIIGSDGEQYEITAGSEKGKNVYYYHQLDMATGNRRAPADADGKELPPNRIDVRSKDQPVLTALMADVRETMQERLEVSRLENEYELRENKRKIHEASNGFLTTINANDLKDDLLKATKDKSLTLSNFSSTDLYKKLKERATAADKNVDLFVASMTKLITEQDNFTDYNDEDSKNYAKADSTFKLFHFMDSGQNYDPYRHEMALATAGVRDNFLNHDIYDKIDNMQLGQTLSINELLDPDNAKQNADITAYFGEKTTITREEVYEYTKDRFDVYAINTLGGLQDDKKLVNGATKEETAAYIAEHADTLTNVTLAMQGRFKNDNGQTVWFVPYERDFDLAYRGLDTPDFNDPQYLGNIKELQERDDRFPSGKMAMTVLNREAQEDLYKTGLPLITNNEALLKAAVERVAKTRGHLDTPYKYEGAVTKKFEGLQDYIKNGQTDFSALAAEDREIMLQAILMQNELGQNTDLGNNAAYQTVNKMYYEQYSLDYLEHRTGHPKLGADGLMQFGADGKVLMQDNAGFNGQYGAIDKDFLTKSYLRVEGLFADRTFGDDIGALLKDRDGNREKNLTYDELRTKILSAENGAQVWTEMDKTIRGQDLASVYQLYMTFNKDEYRENRKSFYRQISEAEAKLEAAAEAAAKAATEAEAEAKEKVEVEVKGKVDADVNDPFSIAAAKMDDGTVPGNEFAKAGPLADIIAGKTTKNIFKAAADNKQVLDESIKAANKAAEKAAATAAENLKTAADKVNFQNDLMAHNPPPTNQFPIKLDEVDPTGRIREEAARRAEEARTLPANRRLPPGHQPPPLSEKIAYQTELMADNPGKILGELDIPDIKIPSKLSRTFSAVGDGVKATFKGASGLGKWVFGIGIVVGGAIGATEIATAEENAQMLHNHGLIDDETKSRLNAIYGGYEAQTLIDGTVVGGEYALKASLIKPLIEEKNIDPIIAEMIFPDLLINYLDSDIQNDQELAGLKEYQDGNGSWQLLKSMDVAEKLNMTLSEDMKKKVNMDVVETVATKLGLEFGLSEEEQKLKAQTMEKLAIALYVRDKNFAQALRSDYLKDAPRDRRGRVQNTPETVMGLGIIQKHIEMTGMALLKLKEHEEALENKERGKNLDQRGRKIEKTGISAEMDKAANSKGKPVDTTTPTPENEAVPTGAPAPGAKP